MSPLCAMKMWIVEELFFFCKDVFEKGYKPPCLKAWISLCVTVTLCEARRNFPQSSSKFVSPWMLVLFFQSTWESLVPRLSALGTRMVNLTQLGTAWASWGCVTTKWWYINFPLPTMCAFYHFPMSSEDKTLGTTIDTLVEHLFTWQITMLPLPLLLLLLLYHHFLLFGPDVSPFLQGCLQFFPCFLLFFFLSSFSFE